MSIPEFVHFLSVQSLQERVLEFEIFTTDTRTLRVNSHACIIIVVIFIQVWKGKLEDRDVAVKIYSPHYREYYNNERTLYRLPFMDHEGLIKFYGADERITQEGSAQLMIVMSYVSLGALNSYLKNNTLDWPTMVRMTYSVAKALSHLHTDIQRGGEDCLSLLRCCLLFSSSLSSFSLSSFSPFA